MIAAEHVRPLPITEDANKTRGYWIAEFAICNNHPGVLERILNLQYTHSNLHNRFSNHSIRTAAEHQYHDVLKIVFNHNATRTSRMYFFYEVWRGAEHLDDAESVEIAVRGVLEENTSLRGTYYYLQQFWGHRKLVDVYRQCPNILRVLMAAGMAPMGAHRKAVLSHDSRPYLEVLFQEGTAGKFSRDEVNGCIWRAVQYASVDVVRLVLLWAGNDTWEFDRRLLYVGAKYNSPAVVRLLLDVGLRPETRGDWERMMRMAAMRGVDMLELAMQQFNGIGEVDGNTSIEWILGSGCLVSAAQRGRVDVASFIFETVFEAVEMQSLILAFFEATKRNHKSLLHLLISKFPTRLSTPFETLIKTIQNTRNPPSPILTRLIEDNPHAHTLADILLQVSIKEGNGKTVQLLFDAGADPLAGEGVVLLEAAKRRKDALVQELLRLVEDSGKRFSPRNLAIAIQLIIARTPKEEPIVCAQATVIRELISAGADLTIDNGKALRLLLRRTDTDETRIGWVKTFMDAGGIGDGSHKLLCEAVIRGDLAVVDYLIENHGIDVCAQDNTALRLSLENQVDFSIIRRLIEAGADVHYGNDWALQLAVQKQGGDLGFVNYLIDECGADVRARNNYPLTLAINHKRDVRIIRKLVEAGADVRANGDEPLRRACWNVPVKAGEEYVDVVRLFLDKGADVHACDNEALRNAYRGERFSLGSLGDVHVELIRLLIERGAYVHMRRDGLLKNRCLITVDPCRLAIVQMLWEAGARLHHICKAHREKCAGLRILEWTLRRDGDLVVGREGIPQVLLDWEMGGVSVSRHEYCIMAAQYGMEDLVRWFVGSRPDVPSWGDEALRYAVREGHIGIANHLLDFGASLNELTDLDFWAGRDALLQSEAPGARQLWGRLQRKGVRRVG
ncbi:hypothetical protein HDV00_002643 [Rhizophlyctis rosea]|nr:hypothetical protein HDV00_002643 [Rhizophlyctis rosea]